MNFSERMNSKYKFQYVSFVKDIDFKVALYVVLKHVETEIIFMLQLEKGKRGVFLYPENEKDVDKKLEKFNRFEKDRIVKEVYEDFLKIYNYLF